MISYCIKTVVEVGRHFTGVRSLFMGNPFHSMVPSFVPLLFVKIIIFMTYGDLSSLEEYFFPALLAITNSFQGDGYG